jgi:hypothetical protein
MTETVKAVVATSTGTMNRLSTLASLMFVEMVFTVLPTIECSYDTRCDLPPVTSRV